MGNSNAIINVTFDRTQPAIYYAGDTISGKVHCIISERTTTVEYIYLTVTGDVGHTTTHVTRMQSGVTKRTTNHHDIRILGEKIILGHAHNLESSGRDRRLTDTTILEPGRYVYPFSVHLPDILPPSIHPNDYPFVRYELQLFIEKKWYCSNSHYRHPLRIFPRVNLSQVVNSECSVNFNTKHKDMTVQGTIHRSGLIPGGQTTISIEIENPERLVIKRVDVCLVQRYSIEQNRRRLEIMHSTIPQLINVDNEHINTTCPITIPKGIPPSYNYRGRGGRSLVHVNIFYDVKLEVKARGLFSDFDVQVPIIIGTNLGDPSASMNMDMENVEFEKFDSLDGELDGDGDDDNGDDNIDDNTSARTQNTNC